MQGFADEGFLIGHRNSQQIIGLVEPMTGGTQKSEFLNNLSWRLPQAHLVAETICILGNPLGINLVRFAPLHPARLLNLQGGF